MTTGVFRKSVFRKSVFLGTLLALAVSSGDVRAELLKPFTQIQPSDFVPILLEDATIGRNYIPMKVSWPPPAASDPGNPHVLEYSVNGGQYESVALPSPTSTSVEVHWALGENTHRYRIKSYSTNAIASNDWIESPVFALHLEHENSPSITYSGPSSSTTSSTSSGTSSGGWKRSLAGGPREWGAANWFMQSASAAGSTVTYTFNGTGFGWIATTGPTNGLADFYLDGKNLGRVDLYTPEPTFGKVVVALGGLKSGAHSVKIQVLGSRNSDSDGDEVAVDGFIRLEVRSSQ